MDSGSHIKNKKLYYKLNVIFILLLLFPCSGFIYLGYKYNLLQNEYIKIFIAIGLFYILIGFTLLRKLFDSIIVFSKTISEKINKEIVSGAVDEN
ncbi:MAG TPA: hypothetical protein ENH42_01040, partial [Desulfobacteraceae bacterium]|nr:hypothetical protein [Desulfobacteraceae bacterium]